MDRFSPASIRSRRRDSSVARDVRGRQLAVALGAVVLGLCGSASTAHAAFPGQNGKLAFTSNRDGNNEVYVMNADGSGQMNLTSNSGGDSGPAWSPDGQKLAFTSDRDGNNEVYVMNADGSGQTNLTSNSGGDSGPAWSPDGQKLAFTSDRDANGNGTSAIYVMNADGSGQTNLTNSANTVDAGPAWSPNGQKLAFVRLAGDFEVYVMNADGSDPTNLSNNAARELDPAWSPDGQKLAFRSSRDGDNEVYVMNADGSGQANLTNNTATDRHPAWETVPSADLALGLAASPDVVRSGQQVTYTITVLNAGPSNAHGVVVTDRLPVESRFVSATPIGGGSCVTPPPGSTGTVTCRLGFLAATAPWVNEIAVKVLAKRTIITNTTSVQSSTPDPYDANNSATITTRVR